MSKKSLAARLLTRVFRTQKTDPIRKPATKPQGAIGGRIEELEDRVVPYFQSLPSVTYVSPGAIDVADVSINYANYVNGASVQISSGYVSAEDRLVLNYSGGASLTSTFNTSTGTLEIMGRATGSEYANILDSVQYYNLASNPSNGDRGISIQLGTATYLADTGHYYEFISTVGRPSLTWYQAQSDAQSRNHLGLTGYLTTITSGAENVFVRSISENTTYTWIGASDEYTELRWRWITGPEAAFESGGGLTFNWNQTPFNGQYNNWYPGYPYYYDGRDHGIMYVPTGQWFHDASYFSTNGYVVEYGGLGATPSFAERWGATIHVLDLTATPTVTTPSSVLNVNAATQTVAGTAVANSLVKVFVDADNNGVADNPSSPAAQQQLSGGATSYSIAVPLTQNAANNFVVTATAYTGANPSSYVDVPTIIEDSTNPTVTSITTASGSPTNATSVSFTVTFSEAVSGVTASDFALTTTAGGTVTGAIGTPTTGNGGVTWTVQVTGLSHTGASGTFRLDLIDDNTIVDVVLNPLGGAGVQSFTGGPALVLDRVAPTVLTFTTASSNPTNAGSVVYNLVFSESVTGLQTTDFITTPAGGLTGAAATGVSGSGTTYTVTFSTGSGSGSFGVQLAAAAVADAAGNALAGAVSGPTYTVDKTAPAAGAATGPAAGTYKVGDNLAVSVAFSEPVFVVGGPPYVSVTIGSTPRQLFYQSGSGTNSLVFRYTVAAGDLDTDGVAFVGAMQLNGGTIRDAVGNDANLSGYAAPSGTNVFVDADAPTVAAINLLSPNPTSADAVQFEVVFSEPMQTLTTSDFIVFAGAGLAGTFPTDVTGSGDTWVVTVGTGVGSGSLPLTVKTTAKDLAGNALAAQVTSTAAYDVERVSGSIDVGGNLVLTASDTASDAIGLSYDAGTNRYVLTSSRPIKLFPAPATVVGNGTTSVSISATELTGKLTVHGGGGDDTLTLDLAGGDAIPAGGLAFNGGAGGNDTLAVLNAPAGNAVLQYTNANDGSVVVPGHGTVEYTGLDPLLYSPSGPGGIEIQLSAAADDVTATVSGSDLILTAATMETTTIPLAGITSLTFTGSANDKVTIASALSQAVAFNVGTVVLNAPIGGTVTGTATAVTVNAPGKIQNGIDAAAAGATVTVGAGTYAENLIVNERVTLDGSGSGNTAADTVISPAGGIGINLVTGGLDATNRLVLKDLRVQGGVNGVYVDSTVGFITLDNVTVNGVSSYGFEVHDAAVVTDLVLTGVNLTNNSVGFRVATTGSVDGLSITNGHIDSNSGQGLYTNAKNSLTNNQTRFTNVTITGTTFDNNGNKGLYFEKLDNATISGIQVVGSGSVGSDGAGLELNLKYGTYTNISLQNLTVTNSGTGNPTTGKGVTLKARNDSPSYNTNPASLSGLTLTNLTVSGSPVALDVGNNISGVTLSGGSLSGTGAGLNYYATAPGTLDLDTMSFGAGLGVYVVNQSANAITATAATFGGLTGATASLAQNFAIEDKITHATDVAGRGLVRVKAGNVYVTAASGSVQRGIDAAAAGDTVNVGVGTFTENITVNKRVTIDGAGSGTDPLSNTVIDGSIAGPAGVVAIAASGTSASDRVVIRDLYIDVARANARAIDFNTAVSFVTLLNVSAEGHEGGSAGNRVTLQPPEQVLRFSAGSRESRACPPWPRSWTTPSSRPSAPAP